MTSEKSPEIEIVNGTISDLKPGGAFSHCKHVEVLSEVVGSNSHTF